MAVEPSAVDSFIGVRAMLQMGQIPGPSWTTWGHMPQVYSCTSSAAGSPASPRSQPTRAFVASNHTTRVPADSAVQTKRMQGEIFINIKADDRIILNERELTIPELQTVLNRVAKYFPGGSVIIRGDRNAVFGRAVSVLNCCKKADIQNVSFAALQEELEGAS